RTAKPHCNTAWQRFLEEGPLAFLPLPDGRSSIVWSTAFPEATRLRGLDDEAFGAALTAAGGAVLGECELSSPLLSFPLKLQYALDYARPRAEVLGDAGGAGYFGEHKLLRRYERWRRSENLLAAGALDGLERLFSNADPLSTGLRSAGLSAVDKLPFVKRRFAQRALGLIGDVPAFLK